MSQNTFIEVWDTDAPATAAAAVAVAVAAPLPIIFTRYLYIKDAVLGSLIYAICKGDKDEALFWGYEIYYSGYQETAIDFVYSIYDNFYVDKNPRSLGRALEKWRDDWKRDSKEWVLGSMIWTLCLRPFDQTSELLNLIPCKRVSTFSQGPVFLIRPSEHTIAKYRTRCGDSTTPARHILKQVCVYETVKSRDVATHFNYLHRFLSDADVAKCYREKWLYYGAPIWQDRIREYGGVCDDRTQTVQFADDVKADAFYEEYEYEPDEQSADVQSKSIVFHV
jgi:hypothetical protein